MRERRGCALDSDDGAGGGAEVVGVGVGLDCAVAEFCRLSAMSPVVQ